MSREDAFAQVYKGKHRHQEVAELVAGTLAIWDRQHGRESRPWETLSVHDQNNYMSRVAAYESERPAPKNDREVFEFELLDILLPNITGPRLVKEDTKTVKEKEGVRGGPLPGSSDVNVQPGGSAPKPPITSPQVATTHEAKTPEAERAGAAPPLGAPVVASEQPPAADSQPQPKQGTPIK